VLKPADLSLESWILHNDAEVSSDTYDPDNGLFYSDQPVSNLATEDTTVINTFHLADLKVTKLTKPDTTALAGQLINYTVIVENLGPSTAYNVTVRDEIRSSDTFTVLSVTAPGYTVTPAIPATGQIITVLATRDTDMAMGDRDIIQIMVQANEAQDINNIVDVYAADTHWVDPNLSNNKAEASIHVTAMADLSLTKTAEPTSLPYPNRALNYTVVVANNGPSTATNVVVKDWLFDELSVFNITFTKGSCSFGVPGDTSRPVVWTVGSLAPGENATMLIWTTLTTGTSELRTDVVTIRNDAAVTSDTYDPDNSNNLASKLIFAGSSPTHKLPSSIDLPTVLLATLTTAIGLASLMFAMRIKKINLVSLVRKRLGSLRTANEA
jgi:uncharacterized repeat protein (TIGR01451 family)